MYADSYILKKLILEEIKKKWIFQTFSVFQVEFNKCIILWPMGHFEGEAIMFIKWNTNYQNICSMFLYQIYLFFVLLKMFSFCAKIIYFILPSFKGAFVNFQCHRRIFSKRFYILPLHVEMYVFVVNACPILLVSLKFN